MQVVASARALPAAGARPGGAIYALPVASEAAGSLEL